MRKLLNLGMALFACVGLHAQSVVDIVVDSPDHQTLEDLVILAELADDLSGDGPFTVFAPTDAAFAALPEWLVTQLTNDPTGELANVLLYHVVGAEAQSSSGGPLQGSYIPLNSSVTRVVTDKTYRVF